jgi:hypothetical protein
LIVDQNNEAIPRWKMVLYLKKRKRSKAENHVVNKRIKLDDVEQYIDLFQFTNVEYIILQNNI